jgi:nucleotide-binding universal stress UspA family protein
MTTTPKLVLVATDFSQGSDEALEAAIGLAQRSSAPLEILHVLELNAEPFPFGGSYYSERGPLIAFIDRELAHRVDRAGAAGVVATGKMIEGSAAVEILQRARDIGADLIVVGTHGRKGLAHVVLGSVAQQVVQRSRCPVLTVPFSKRAA